MVQITASAVDRSGGRPFSNHQGNPRLLEALGVGSEAHRNLLLPLHQATWKVESLEVHKHSLKHLEGSVRDLVEALHRGFIMGLQMVPFM
jgi:hypothetical protein